MVEQEASKLTVHANTTDLTITDMPVPVLNNFSKGLS
jgi:hypothetical protein